jgi:DNA-directed RNA polymerase specialized sigma24 family protein
MGLADRVGRRVANEFPGLEAEDIASEALVRLAERAEKLPTDDEGYVYRVLYREAVRYAAKERYDHMMGTATFVYTPREVRALLQEAYFDPAAWDVPTAKDDYLTATVTKDTLGVSLMDLHEAWKKLKASYREILLRRFRDDEEVKDTKAVTRAVEALTWNINRRVNRSGYAHEGPGTRQVMSNAEARYVTHMEAGCDFETFQKDAVHELDALRTKEPLAPAGTYYDWGS